MKTQLITLFTLCLIIGSCGFATIDKNAVGNVSNLNFIEVRKGFKTVLTKEDKAPQNYQEFVDMNEGIKLVNYESDGRQLKALLETSIIDPRNPKPAVVFLHGGFALGYGDVTDCKAFTDAGFIVFAPSYRGENGNAGNYELFCGEVDDAKAAINWLKSQPFIDGDRVSVFGHSIGGGMSLHLSLHDDLEIYKSGSSAGLYDIDAINYWASEKDRIPYNYQDKAENYMRLPLYSLDHMVRPHQMYIGEDDGFNKMKYTVDQLYSNKTKLNLIKMEGDHFSSFDPAVEAFIAELKK